MTCELLTCGENQRLVAALNGKGVRFLIVGGVAVRFHVPERVADDLDLLIEPTLENARRVEGVLFSLNHPPVHADFAARLGGGSSFAQVMLKREYYADLITRTDVDFSKAWNDAHEARIGQSPVRVASAATMLELLSKSPEEKHLRDAELLTRLLGSQ